MRKLNLLNDQDVEIVPIDRKEKQSKIKLVSARQIQEMKIPPIRWMVKDLLPEGLTILAGSPKAGKSFMALNIALSVANGARALGCFETEVSDILYLALEDNFRRIQTRLNDILHNEIDKRAPENIYFLQEVFDFPKLNDGGVDEIKKIMNDNEEIKFIIVDTMGRSIADKKRKDSNNYRADYDMLAGLHELTLRKNICILIIHHTKKAHEEDVFNEISGTTGITGAVDTMMVLKKRNNSGKLYLRGREIKDGEHNLVFDEKCCWNIVDEEINITAERKEIYELLKSAGRAMKTGDIAGLLGKTSQNISKMLGKMLKDGIVATEKTGWYFIPEQTKERGYTVKDASLFNERKDKESG